MDSYRRYGPALVRKARRVLGNHADAQDVVQALFMELLASGERARYDLPYLYRAVTHRCLSLLRDEKNRARLLAQHQPLLRGQARTRCDDEVLGLDLLVKLTQALSAREAELVVYRYFDDLSQDEISELCGVSRKTVGKDLEQVRSAVRRLRDEGAAW
jgi:RNA polymerase sigma-70 factor, ECF subfamily